MVSRASDSASKVKNFEGEQANEAFGTLSTMISQLKKQIQATRSASIKGKLRRNGKNLEVNTSQLLELATSKKDLISMEEIGLKNMLSFRSANPLCKLSGSGQGSGEKDNVNSQEVLPSTIIKLPYVEKIPPYTTWIFLDKNQRMAEDQSVVGRRQIYYDQYGGETLICSDSEEEFAEPEEGKHEFSEGEDQMLWKVFQEHGLTQEVLNILSQSIEATSSEIQGRCNILMEKYAKKIEGSGEKVPEKSTFLDKSLNMALDSFDNLFCRRCLVFDCRLHGCSQSLIIPSEKQPSWCESEENGKPCGDHCYLWARKVVKEASGRSDTSTLCRLGDVTRKDQNPLYSKCEEPSSANIGTDITHDERCSGGRMAGISSDIAVTPKVSARAVNNDESTSTVPLHENLGKRKVLKHVSEMVENSKPGSNDFQDSASKKQKKIAGVDVVYVSTEGQPDSDLISRENIRHPDSGAPDNNGQKKAKHVLNESVEYTCKKYLCSGSAAFDENNNNIIACETNNPSEKGVLELSSNSKKGQIKGARSGCEWKPIEKELYLKGIEIFGRNSCLIARNLLSGLKTCIEVSIYMCNDGDATPQRTSVLPDSCLDDSGKADTDYTEQEMPTRSRLFRRRGRARKLKYTWKSTGHPSIRKRIADGKHQSCKQYTPCGCQFTCGKQCPCLRNGTCCEKYCGCSKGCKNRFRGCHCAKSQCRSRQCPCFAAGRECDPDVCRNCWISCGDGSLGEPPARGDGYQCGNMKLLLKQQQRILLAKSDVAGWGAFIKNPVNKNDYLGEYTGELISHREADKRGKIYDRANSSFLFDLNDQYVLDAYRKGDKLKFANHSSNPNCYAKVMLVAGDHRVGIFAKEHIETNEELFYDYRYCPDQAPVWARKPGSSKRDDSTVSHGRAQKHQSH